MKIAIIGRGTSAIITALTCVERGNEVEIYYDPDKSYLNIGEGTTPHVAQPLLQLFNLSIQDLVDNGIVSRKHGVEFNGWGIGNSFKHHFEKDYGAFHFESSLFNEFVCNKLEERGVIYHALKIEDYTIDEEIEKVIVNNIQYDHLIWCSGWDDADEYENPTFETVNNALLYTRESTEYQTYSDHLATVDGWQFGLPFPERNIVKHGYLFNDKITSLEDAKRNLNVEDCTHISWSPKYCKKLIQNRFCSYNGNRLMFFEPLQALSLYYYRIFADTICNFVENTYGYDMEVWNKSYLSDIKRYQISLAWHYSYGSIHETPFWEDIKDRARNLMMSNSGFDWDTFRTNMKYNGFELDGRGLVGIFENIDFIQVDCGMTGETDHLLDIYTQQLLSTILPEPIISG